MTARRVTRAPQEPSARRARSRAACAIAMLVATGCVEHARVAMRNAPGNVDLTTPMPHENGDPKRYEQPELPGTATLSVIPMPSVLFGTGRVDTGRAWTEVGLAVRLEHHESPYHQAFGDRALAFTAGVASAQLDDNTAAFGPLFAEINYRFPSWRGMPTDLGIGPAFYASDRDLGAQLTLRIPLLAVRGRYVQHSGFEVWAGFELPIPLLFQRSR